MEKSSMNHKETPYLQLFPCKKYCISLCTEFLYNVYQCSLQRLWGLPATFTIFPINIEDFPLCNTGTPQNFHNVFSRNIYWKKQYESQGNPILIRCPVPSTDQALPSCFYFRISWILMEWHWFYFFLSPSFSAGPQKPQTLTPSKSKYENFWPKI